MGYLYIISSGKVNKIGITKGDPKRRLAQLQTGSYTTLRLVKAYRRKDYKQLERRLHWVFRNRRLEGEWFNVPANEIIQEIEKGNKMYRFIEVMAYLWTIMLACVVIAIGYMLFIGMFY